MLSMEGASGELLLGEVVRSDFVKKVTHACELSLL